MATFFSTHKTLKGKKSAGSSDDGSWDTSPYGTLTRSTGTGGTGASTDSNKYRANARAKLPSIFNPFVKAQDKQEQLSELLSSYTLHGLPKMPDSLTRGRPHYDQSAFTLERHWTDIVANHDRLNKRQRDQQEAVWELLSTEVEYLRKLRVIIDLFMCCLFHLQSEQLLTEIEVDKVFSNIGDVFYATCHFWVSHMGQVLRQARKTREVLDPCLLKAGFLVFDKIFEPYTKYCLEQDICREYIKTKTMENELFRTFVTWGERQKQCNRLKLVDLIGKPWQRLTKYKLLLYAVLRPLDGADPMFDADEQKKDIGVMIENVEKFLHHVNVTMRQKHNHKQLSLVVDRIESYDAVDAPSDECDKLVSEFCKLDLTCPVPGCGQQEMRILLLEGALKLKDRDSKTDVYCFLFTDMFLVTKPATKRGDKVKVIKPPMRLDKIIICGLRDVASFMLLYLNEYHVAQAVYTLHGDSKLWLDNIVKAQEEYREKRNKYLSRSESLLFDLYDETVDDDEFVLYIDRASTPVDRRSAEPGSVSTSRGSSVTRSGQLQPPDPAEPVQRSSSYAGEVAAGKTAGDAVVEWAGGRLPRPRSAVVTRESAAVTSTSTPSAAVTSTSTPSARDDVVTTTPAADLLTVPTSSWYRTEVATNVGPGSRRLTANVQLGLPPPYTTSVTTGPDEGVSTSTSTTTTSVSTVSEACPSTASDCSTHSDVIVSTSRHHGTSRRRTSAGSSDTAADERPRFSVDEDAPPVSRRSSVRSRRSAAARPPSPPPDYAASVVTPDTGSHVIQSDARPTDCADSGPMARRRMTAAERRRLKNELLSNSSLEVSEV